MQIQGMPSSSHILNRVIHNNVEHIEHDDVKVKAKLNISSAFFEYGDDSNKYRPVIHFDGEIRSLTPLSEVDGEEVEVQLEYGIDRIDYRYGLGPAITGFYEFNDEELSRLVAKGYFNPDFEVPEVFTEVDFDVPMESKIFILPPESSEDVPVVFVELPNAAETVFGYDDVDFDFVNSFENTLENTGISQEQEVVQESQFVDALADYQDETVVEPEVEDVESEPEVDDAKPSLDAQGYSALSEALADYDAENDIEFEAQEYDDVGDFEEEDFSVSPTSLHDLDVEQAFEQEILPAVEVNESDNRERKETVQTQVAQEATEESVVKTADGQEVEALDLDEEPYDEPKRLAREDAVEVAPDGTRGVRVRHSEFEPSQTEENTQELE